MTSRDQRRAQLGALLRELRRFDWEVVDQVSDAIRAGATGTLTTIAEALARDMTELQRLREIVVEARGLLTRTEAER